MNTSASRAEQRARLEAAGALVQHDDSSDVQYFTSELVNDYQPTIPTRVRDAAYIGGLVVSGAIAITVPTISALVPDAAGVAAQIGVAVSAGVGMIVAGLGVVYRPGSQR